VKKINIVIPIYNEEQNIIKIFKDIIALDLEYGLEIIFVNDGSTDDSLQIIKKLSEEHSYVKYISFSRNFGHQIALSAGLDFSDGDFVITMDADFQHPVKHIPDMIKKYKDGFNIVQMVKKNQGKRNFFIKIYTFLFYYLFRKFSDINISNNVSDFRLIDKSVNNELKRFIEKERFLRGLVQWVGFNYTELEYIPEERRYGYSKYNFFKLLKLASFGIFAFSTIPLKLSLYSGLLLSIFSFLYGSFALIKKFTLPETIPIGYTDLIVFITFIGGIQLIFLGLIGLYISKIYDQVRQRPLYIVREKNINV
jgi:polyisoprenyl-phosphate glycosyltransferase